MGVLGKEIVIQELASELLQNPSQFGSSRQFLASMLFLSFSIKSIDLN
jgi:hypothetical protein